MKAHIRYNHKNNDKYFSDISEIFAKPVRIRKKGSFCYAKAMVMIMYSIKLLNKISGIENARLGRKDYVIGETVKRPDAIMVRSAVMTDMEFNPELLCIACAGTSVTNIPVERCTKAGICVFNTPGSNANGVKELTLCALFLAARRITDGIEWEKALAGNSSAARLIEKKRAEFAGSEIFGKTLGVIGLGAIGGLVANAAVGLGMKVIGCDPYLSVESAWRLSCNVEKATQSDIFAEADYITLHIPLTPQTKNLINRQTLSEMKDGVRIINLSNAGVVDAEAIASALASGKVASYVTDFAAPSLIGLDGVVAIPHLGSLTAESDANCALMAADQIDNFIRNGNIKNSVNFPDVSVPFSGSTRVCIFHDNIPNMIAQISAAFSEEKLNIDNLVGMTRGDNAYSIIDINTDLPVQILNRLNMIKGINRVRIINK